MGALDRSPGSLVGAKPVVARVLPALVGILVVVAGCAPAEQPAVAPAPEGGVSRERDKSITIIMNRDPSGFGPHQSTDSNLTPVFLATLTRYKVWDGKYEPWLASEAPSLERGSWKTLPDGRMETTWKLRQNIKWHDGTAFSAKDLVFGWQLVLDPQFAALEAAIPHLMESVTAPDDHTLVIVWKQIYIYANLCVRGCMTPQPRHILEAPYRQEPTTLAGHPYFTTEYVGQGPYRVALFEPGQGIDFEAFPEYFLGKPKIHRIFYRVVADSNAALVRVMANDVDLSLRSNVGFTQSLTAREQWEAQGHGKVHYVQTGMQRVALSPTNSFFRWDGPTNVKTREALLYAIDRPEIANVLFQGVPGVPNTIVRPTDPIYPSVDRAVKKRPYDPDTARRLLAEAGWRPGPDGVLANDRGERFSIEAQATAGDAQEEAVQATVVDYWRAIGVESRINNLGRRVLRGSETRAQWAGARWTGGSLEPNDPFYTDWHSRFVPTKANGWEGDNRAHWSGGDALLGRWAQEVDGSKREDLRVQIALRWAEDLPELPLIFNLEISTIAQKLVNVSPRLGSGGANAITWNIEQWDLK